MILIIDDLGYQKYLGQQAINLPGSVTLSFLPKTRYAKELAQQAYLQGKEVMLHVPMENLANYDLGQEALTTDMDKQQLQATLMEGLNSVPHVSGINNHMGSLLTQNKPAMTAVMKILKEQGLYFVDSRTTPLTLAAQTAREFNIPTLERKVFLDNELDAQYLAQQFNKAVLIAEQRGHAVIIGHPYPETMSFLKERLTNLTNIKLVTPKEFFAMSSQHKIKQQSFE